MTKKQKLQGILDIAQMEEQGAARQLSELLMQQQLANSQLDSLSQYLTEYQQMQQSGSASPVSFVKNHQNFLNKLNQAIEQQQQQILAIQQNVNIRMQSWQRAKNRCKALEKTLQRRQALIKQKAEHRQQIEIDNLVQRQNNFDRFSDPA